MIVESITFCVRSFPPAYRGGGPSRSVAAMTEALTQDADVRVITAADDYGIDLSTLGVVEGVWGQRHGAQVLNVSAGIRGLRQQLSELRKASGHFLYLGSLFEPRFTLLPLIAARVGLIRASKVIVAPRGELDPAALASKTQKKRLYLEFVRRTGLLRDVTWHATNETELKQIQQHFGESVRSKIAPNIAHPRLATPPTNTTSSGTRAVFMSRIDDKKNLLVAIEALVHSPTTALTIIGPVSSAPYWQQCQNRIDELGLGERINYLGELPLDDVAGVLETFDLFFFPTLGENFGHAILEALAAGLPALISDTTPWNHVQERGAGWAVRPDDVVGFAERLAEFSVMSGEQRLQMAMTAIELAREHIDDPTLSNSTRELFHSAVS